MMRMANSKMTLDKYSKLKSGESFMKLKEIDEGIIEPIVRIFDGNGELEEYLLSVLLTYLSLSVGKNNGLKGREEDRGGS